MTVSIVRYALIVLALSISCRSIKPSRTKNNEFENDDETSSRQFSKPKELLRHQQQRRPHFIDRRLNLDAQRYLNEANEQTESYRAAATSTEISGDLKNHEDDSNVDENEREALFELENEKNVNYELPRNNNDPECDKSAAQIRHGRSRGHLGRSSSRIDSFNATVKSFGATSDEKTDKSNKNRDSSLADARNVENNETSDLDFAEIAAASGNVTGIFEFAENDSSKPGETLDGAIRESDRTIDDETKVVGDDDEKKSREGWSDARIEQADSPDRVLTRSIDVSGSSRLLDSYAKLRKVVSSNRNPLRSRERDRNMVFLENSTSHRAASGRVESIGYGTVVRVKNDDNDGKGRDTLLEGSTVSDVDRGRHREANESGNSSTGITDDYDNGTNDYNDMIDYTTEYGKRRAERPQDVHVDIVTRFLRIIENQHFLGENCTAGTDLNLGEGVVDQYAQERFRLEANLAVNRANMLTRLWKYAPEVMLSSEYLLHASILSMVEFDEDIFAAGNCYDKLQYRDRWLYCPFAHRLQDQDGVLVKDLAVEYKYLSNSSEWFYIARKNAERVIANHNQFSRGFHTYTHNESAHSNRIEDEILTVKYEDGRWSKPYYDCGGGNIWMLTYTVPFFGYVNDTYFFKGTSGIDIDLRRVDIDQCPLPPGSTQLNIFAASDKCKNRTTECVATMGLGFRRGSYRCVCKRGYYYPDTKSVERYYNGTVIEEEYEKLMLGEESQYNEEGIFECLPCAEGCEFCEDGSPCVASLNWLMRTAILILECCIIAFLPAVILFTWKYGNVKVVRAASPVLLRVIVLGAFFIYSTTIVMYPRPNVVTCTIRVWLREIGFSLTYGALMLKTWRISVIFRVKSAKAVKITDMNLLKRLGIIVTIFTVFLGIRTLVAPPVVIVGRTADDLKAYLCRTDWWDHSFTTLEVMFLVWGIRLCIVVRKAPSEFNESRFISMAIYNEFLLSVFLNVSMLFLQSPANPDLLYIIFFCHTQLTVTLLLCLIFGSKAYVVFRGGGKEDSIGKLQGTGKFIGKTCRTHGTSNQTNSISMQQGNFTDEPDGVTEEFRRLYAQLELLKEKNMRLGNRHLATKIQAMQEAAGRAETQVSTIQAISSSLRLSSEKTSSLIEETDVSTLRDEKSLDFRQQQQQLQQGPDDSSVARNKGENKQSLEAKNVTNCKTPTRVEIEENKNRANVTAIENSSILTNSEATKDRKNEDSSMRNERDRTDEINRDFTVEKTEDELAVASSGRNLTNSTVAENGETSGVLETATRSKDSSAETPGGPAAAPKETRGKSKSGHARTHAIVINLDDKSRFSEEVTV